MDVAAALVIVVYCRSKKAMTVIVTSISDVTLVARQGVAVPTSRVTVLFVRTAVLNRDANHLPGSKRDQALHKEQQNGDEFDKRVWNSNQPWLAR